MTDDAVDYWREVARLGVMALGFSIGRAFGAPVLSAEFVEPLDGWTRRAAKAALALHKEAQLSQDAGLVAAHDALLEALESSAAVAELAAYQTRLAKTLWTLIQEDPPRLIEALGYSED